MNETQESVLRAIGSYQGTCTPQALANALSHSTSTHWSWQGAARVASQLAHQGLVRAHKLPKMTWYELTPTGQKEAAGEREL